VPAEFCLQAVQKRIITVKSSRRAQRDFITVGTTAKRICDFVEGMDFWDGQVKLVASGRSFTIGVVAKIVAELAEEVIGAPVQIESKFEIEPDSREPELQVILDYHHPVESAGFIELEFRNAILDLLHLANIKAA
jgi:nucleoside-diphosphate-sugar epimerase